MDSFLNSLNVMIDESKKIEFKYTDDELIKRYNENIGEIFILKKKGEQYGGEKFKYDKKMTEKILSEINFKHRKYYYKNMTYVLHIIHKYIIKKFNLANFETYMLTNDEHYSTFFKNASINILPKTKLTNVYMNTFGIPYNLSVNKSDDIFNYINKIIENIETGGTLIFDTRFIFDNVFSEKIQKIIQKFDECIVYIPNIYTVSSGYISFILKGKKNNPDNYELGITYQKVINNLTNWIDDELYIYNYIISLRMIDQSKHEVLNNKLVTASISNLL